MRKAKGVLGVIAGLMLLFHAGGTVAVASDHRNSPPGNNGTIKIHEGAGEQDPVQANDPHVCTFHIHGSNFDSNASGTWRLEQQAPTGNAAMRNGTWAADGNGDWRTGVMTLPDGHYQAHAKQTVGATPGGEKTKTFWVECGQSTTTGGGTGTATTTTGGTTGSSSGGSSGGTNTSTSTSTTGSTTGGTGTSTSTGGATSGGTGNANGNANGNGTGGQGNVTGGNTELPGGASGATSGGTATGGQGNVNTTSGEVAGQGVSPSVQYLPSTSTAGDSAPIAIFGGLLVAFGAFLLRRSPGQSRSAGRSA